MKPRIAQVLATSAGGVGQHVLSLTHHLVEHGWPVTVCAPASTHARFDFSGAGARCVTMRLGAPGSEARAAWPIRRATSDAALIHAHGLRAGLAAVLAGRRPLVVTLHNAVLQRGPAGRVMALGERVVARGATVCLAASDDLADRARTLGGRDVRYLPVAAPQRVALRTRAQMRAELGVADEQLLALTVARLHPQKALDVLVEAAAGWPGVRVVVAGDGPLRAQLQAQIDNVGAPVRLLGHRDDVPDLLAAADLFLLSSRWEARPLVVQEAMRAGLPVVATDVGGVRGLTGDAADLVAPGDVAALREAVGAVLAAPERRRALADRATVRAATWPDEEQAAAVIAEVYGEVLRLG